MTTQKTTLSRVLLAALLNEWRVTRRVGSSIILAPVNRIERRTPDNIPSSWWGSPTYPDFRTLAIFVIDDARVEYTVSTGVPWATGTNRKVKADAAVEFILETTRLAKEAREELAAAREAAETPTPAA